MVVSVLEVILYASGSVPIFELWLHCYGGGLFLFHYSVMQFPLALP